MNMNLDFTEKILAFIISLLGALGVKRFWDIFIEKTKADVENKKQDVSLEIAKIKSNESISLEITKIKDEQIDFYRKELVDIKQVLVAKEMEIKDLQSEIKRLEHEKDKLQNDLIKLKQGNQ